MPGDIRQALLCDPVNDEFHARIQPWQVALEVPPHPHARALLEDTGKAPKSAGKPHVIEKFRAQLLGEPAHILQARLHHLLRFCQLGLLRVARAGGHSLERGNHSVVLRVIDNGHGFDRRHAEGGGLRGIRERALIVGGAAAIKPGPGGGVEVRLEAPAEAA